MIGHITDRRPPDLHRRTRAASAASAAAETPSSDMTRVTRTIALALALLALRRRARTACTCGDAKTYSVTDVSRLRIAGPVRRPRPCRRRRHRCVPPGRRRRSTGFRSSKHEEVLVVKPLPGGWGGWPMGFHGKLVVDVTMPSLDQAAVTGSGDTDGRSRSRATRSDAGALRIGQRSPSTGIQATHLDATIDGIGRLLSLGRPRVASAKAVLTGIGRSQGGSQLRRRRCRRPISSASGNLTIGVRRAARGSLAGSGDLDDRRPRRLCDHAERIGRRALRSQGDGIGLSSVIAGSTATKQSSADIRRCRIASLRSQ